MDYALFILFFALIIGLLFGMSKQEKKWIGGTGALLAVIFIIGAQIIKFQSGFFKDPSVEASSTVGEWVLPWFITLGLYLLGMINYRWIEAAWKKQSWQRWGLIVLDILFSLIYLWFGWFLTFILAFTYFPFAP